MSTETLIDRLAAFPDLAGVPREQLAWVVSHSEFRCRESGTVLRGGDITGLVVLLSGRISVRTDQHGMEREVREILPGRVTGHLPYSRMTNPRGYLVADGSVEFLEVRLEDLREMTRECYEFTGVCVQEMLARVRVFKSEDKQQEKMAALGRLAAGLAHELNNPASAVVRAAGELDASREGLVAASRALGAEGLDETSLSVLRAVELAAQVARSDALTPVGRAALEDDFMDWLDGHGADSGLAYPLAESSVTIADLDAASRALSPLQLVSALRYLAALSSARGLAADIVSASKRIHSLVAAVKKHTHMDRAPTVEPIQLSDHLQDVMTLMRSKASTKDVALDLTVDADLPMVMGSVADLNQVWVHLIDNAIDALDKDGRIALAAKRGSGSVVVSVIDDGSGIPAEDQERVFEPFFTTKDVSQGRGLGLDIVRTVVRTHRGSVDLCSRPGRTEFRVTLPAAETP